MIPGTRARLGGWAARVRAWPDSRSFAVVGIVWNVALLAFLLVQEGVPILWKVAWAVYGGFGLVALTASLMRKDEGWSKGLHRAQIVTFLFAMLLFAIGMTQFR